MNVLAEMSPEDRLGETGALLIKRNVFTRENLQALASIGVETPETLIALACDPGRRQQVAAQFDLSEDDLLTAAFLAKLLTVQGPGAVLAHRAAAETDLSSWADSKDRESNQAVLECEPAVFVKLLAEIAEDSVKERATAAQRIGNRNKLRLWLVFIVLASAAMFVSQWSAFFRPTRGEAVLVAVRGFVRAGVLIDMGLMLAMTLGLVLIMELLSAISSRVLPQQWIYNKYLSWRDRLIAIEAFALLPPRRAKIVEWLQNNLILPAAVIIAIFAVATISLKSSVTVRWAGYLVLLGAATLPFLLFLLQAQAFSRLAQKTSWASPTRERYAEAQALRLPLALGASALVIYFALVPAFRIGLEALSHWYEHQQTLSTSAFETSLDQLKFAPDQQAAWTTTRAEWITWSQQWADAGVTMWQDASEEMLYTLEILRRTLMVGLLGLLLAVALAEYLYASRPKGALSLGIWAVALVASEYFPDRVAQAIGVSETTAVGAILTLALAAFIGVIGELGLARRERRAERVCPNPDCFSEIAGEARFCPNCGAALRQEMNPWESLS